MYKISRTYSLWAWILPQLIVRAHCTTTTTRTKLNNSEKNNWAFFMNVFIFVFRVTKGFSVVLLLFWRLQFLIHETNANVNTNGCACECEYSLWHLYLYSLLTRWSLVWSMGQFCCSPFGVAVEGGGGVGCVVGYIHWYLKLAVAVRGVCVCLLLIMMMIYVEHTICLF